MKIKVQKSDILPALRSASRAVSPKSPLPILAGLKITATGDGKLVITGTDLEMGITCTVPAEVIETGTLIIPAVTLVSYIEKMPAEFTMSGKPSGAVTIKYGKSEANMNGFPVDEFPEPPTIISNVKFSVSGQVLCETLSHVVYAASDDESRAHLCGVNFEIKGGELLMAATDTSRLAVGSLALEGVEQEHTVILPKKAMLEVVKLFKTAEIVAVNIGENQVAFASDGITMTFRIIGGAYPNYKAVLPKDFEVKIRVKPLDFINTLERVSVLSGGTVALLIKDGKVEVTTGSERGSVREDTEASVDGADMKINFNANYLIEAVKNAVTDNREVGIGFSGPLSPALVQAAMGGTIISIVLPVRLRDEAPAAGQEAQKKAS